MPHASQYSDATLDEMQTLYGEGYLSPGGAEEVDAILDGVAVRGRRVLDLGCGVGGAAIRIVRELHARSVVGIDVEERTVERAAAAAREAGLDRRVSFELTAPGPVPLRDESVDVVFCKDVICPPCRQGAAVLGGRAGAAKRGALSRSGTGRGGARRMRRAQSYAPDGLELHFEPLARYLRGLERCGFESIGTRNHSAWLLERTRRELETVLRLREEGSDPAAMEKRIAVTRRRLENLKTGRLEHWHVQASRSR